MTNDERSRTARDSDFVIASSFDIRHSSLPGDLIATASQLAQLLPKIESFDRVAIDTEADSLHCYREKLCLLQLSVPQSDHLVDPLANFDLTPLSKVLERKEIILHGSDFDLRLLRRTFDFKAQRVFDTVIAARLLGIRAFSLAALVQRYFGVELSKGSQKANWAQRPLPPRMLEYAVNDTRYLLPMAEKLEAELQGVGRFDWFQQSCQRALEQAGVDRIREADDAWRITGAGKLRGRAAAVLREIWHWRETEAQAADRPPFHILQNHELLRAAEAFSAGDIADYRHFSPRRRQAFREAAERALQSSEAEWPVVRRRLGSRPSAEVLRRSDQLRAQRDRITGELGLEPAFLAPRSALEAIATDPAVAATLLVPWQRQLLDLEG